MLGMWYWRRPIVGARNSLTAARAIVSGTAAVAMLAVQLTVRARRSARRTSVLRSSRRRGGLLRSCTTGSGWRRRLGHGCSDRHYRRQRLAPRVDVQFGFFDRGPGFPCLAHAALVGMLMGVDVDRAVRAGTSATSARCRAGERLSSAGIRLGRRVPAWWQWTLPTGVVLLCQLLLVERLWDPDGRTVERDRCGALRSSCGVRVRLKAVTSPCEPTLGVLVAAVVPIGAGTR